MCTNTMFIIIIITKFCYYLSPLKMVRCQVTLLFIIYRQIKISLSGQFNITVTMWQDRSHSTQFYGADLTEKHLHWMTVLCYHLVVVCVTMVTENFQNVMLLSHSGEYMANGLTNAIRHEFAMIAKCSPDIRRCS